MAPKDLALRCFDQRLAPISASKFNPFKNVNERFFQPLELYKQSCQKILLNLINNNAPVRPGPGAR